MSEDGMYQISSKSDRVECPPLNDLASWVQDLQSQAWRDILLIINSPLYTYYLVISDIQEKFSVWFGWTSCTRVWHGIILKISLNHHFLNISKTISLKIFYCSQSINKELLCWIHEIWHAEYDSSQIHKA